jgi:hypothetical protein
MRDRSSQVVRASEVAQYVYCARAWWLGSVEGLPSAHTEALESGTAAHRQHGRQVQRTDRISRLAYLSLGLALLMGLAWLIQMLVFG